MRPEATPRAFSDRPSRIGSLTDLPRPVSSADSSCRRESKGLSAAEGSRVTKAGAPVHLEPKAIELLLFLAGTRGRLVTKAEMQDIDAKEARYIETVPTRGYRALPGGIGSWS